MTPAVPPADPEQVWTRRLERERRARREAERLLESKALELFSANTQLAGVRDALAARVDELEAERARALSLASTDSLTGLANRGAFTALLAERLAHAQPDAPVALFVIDLDRFKHLNDALGHHAGDALLAEIGRRLRAQAGPDDVVARLGGDEFALISTGVDPEHRARALVRALSRIHEIDGRHVQPGASVGVAVAPADTADLGDLQRFADLALYHAKGRRGRRWKQFDAELRAQSDRRRMLESELRRAIPAGEIEPWFQPIVDAAAGRTIGVEVLARWRHPDEGLLSPAVFVPLAEQAGLLGQIDEHLFTAACEAAAPWVAAGLLGTVSVNVSPRELLDPGFSRELIRRLAATRLPPTALNVEITETFLLHDFELARRHIFRLHAHGVRIALDDFGMGYSNLRTLTQLPIDAIKLDKSLIDDVGRDSRISQLIRAMLATARALGLRVVAEGVEAEDQAVFLRAAGCDRMQGYWFARPMPAGEIEARLAGEVRAERAEPRAVRLAG